jgi:hypothetical protein
MAGGMRQVRQHHDVTIPDMPDAFACAGSPSVRDMTTYGYTRSGTTTSRIMGRNPATPGTYNVYIEYKDTHRVVHQDAPLFTVKESNPEVMKGTVRAYSGRHESPQVETGHSHARRTVPPGS